MRGNSYLFINCLPAVSLFNSPLLRGDLMIRLRVSLALFGCVVLSARVVAQQHAGRPSLNAEQVQAETVHFLVDLIRIDTQDPPGNESKVARYIESVLQREGIKSEILEPVAGRASIVARLKGDGRKRPVLILAHDDV